MDIGKEKKTDLVNGLVDMDTQRYSADSDTSNRLSRTVFLTLGFCETIPRKRVPLKKVLLKIWFLLKHNPAEKGPVLEKILIAERRFCGTISLKGGLP